VDTSKNISLQITRTRRMVDDLREQCLRFYYYMTVYNDLSDRGQKIGIYMTDNQTLNFAQIDMVTIQDMRTNGWQYHNVTFNSSADNYMVKFFFLIYPKKYLKVFYHSSCSVLKLMYSIQQILPIIDQFTSHWITWKYTIIIAHVSKKILLINY
jgi:hypothetical protein